MIGVTVWVLCQGQQPKQKDTTPHPLYVGIES